MCIDYYQILAAAKRQSHALLQIFPATCLKWKHIKHNGHNKVDILTIFTTVTQTQSKWQQRGKKMCKMLFGEDRAVFTKDLRAEIIAGGIKDRRLESGVSFYSILLLWNHNSNAVNCVCKEICTSLIFNKKKRHYSIYQLPDKIRSLWTREDSTKMLCRTEQIILKDSFKMTKSWRQRFNILQQHSITVIGGCSTVMPVQVSIAPCLRMLPLCALL